MARQYSQEFNIKDKGSASIKSASEKIKKSLTSVEKKSATTTKSMKNNWKGVVTAIGAGYASIQSMNRAFEMAKVGETIRVQTDAFAKLSKSTGVDGQKLIKNLKEISNQTIDTASLMTTAGTAMLLGIPADKLGKLMEIARTAIKITGESTAVAFSDISLAVARMSKEVLDNLGIEVSLLTAYKNFGKGAAKSLTDVQKKQAFLNENIRIGEIFIKKIGLSTGNEYEEMSKLISNLKEKMNNISVLLSVKLNPAIRTLNKNLDGVLYVLGAIVGVPIVGWLLLISARFLKLASVAAYVAATISFLFISKTGSMWSRTHTLFRLLSEKLLGLPILWKIALVNIAALVGLYTGKMIDTWAQQFKVYRRYMVGLVDFTKTCLIDLKYLFKHPFGGTLLSKAKLKEEMAYHKVTIRQWLKDIRTETTHGVLLIPIPKVPKVPKVTKASKVADIKDTAIIPMPEETGDKVWGWGDVQEAYRGIQENLQDMYKENQQKMKDGAQDTQTHILKLEKDKADKIIHLNNMIADTMSVHMTNGIMSVLDGTESLGESFKKMASNIVNEITAMILKMLIFKAIMSGISAFGGGGGDVTAFAKGGIINQPTIFPMANGAGLMGEAGPEAVMPLKRGPGGRLGVEMSGGSGGEVTIINNVTVDGGDDQASSMKQGKLIGEAITAKIKQTLIQEKRPGGLLMTA